MFAISVLVFLIFFATPGVNPAARIAGRSATPEVLRQVSKEFGLNRPLPIRYGLMMFHLFIKQDLTSYVNIGDKIVPQIMAAAPMTLSLVFGAVVIWLLVGISGGVIAAKNRGKFIDPGHVLRHRRNIDSGLLARRDGLARHPGRDCIVDLLVGAQRRDTCRSPRIPGEWALHLLFPG